MRMKAVEDNNLRGVNYDVDIPAMLGSDVVVSDFWKSEHRNMRLEFEDEKSARLAWGRYRRYINRNKLAIRAKVIEEAVYLIKVLERKEDAHEKS
jgi:hypothetical protein